MTGLLHEKEFSRKNVRQGRRRAHRRLSVPHRRWQVRPRPTRRAAAGDHPVCRAFASGPRPTTCRTCTQIDSWITINADNTVTVTHGETELGHGTPTGILMFVAEELSMNMTRCGTRTRSRG